MRMLMQRKDKSVRSGALEVLIKNGEDKIKQRLLSLDGVHLFEVIDPQEPIDKSYVDKAFTQLEIPEPEVVSCSKTLAEKYGLKLAF
jgi:hypothetical protein